MNTTADDTTLPSSSPPDTGDQAASTDEALDVQLDDAAAATGTAAAVEREQAAMETTCATGDGEVYWEQTGETTRRKQPIHTDYLANNLKHRYEWSNTRETKASIIYAGTGKNYGGGLSYSVVDGVGFDDTLGAGQENVNHVWNAIWQFNQEEKFCFNAGYSYSMGKKRWRPYKFTGFSRITNDASRWSCDSRWRGPIQIDTWVSRSSTVTFNGWFSIAGVTGSVQQTNTTAHKATYIKKNGVDSAVLCGKGGYPVDVPFVEEMYKA